MIANQYKHFYYRGCLSSCNYKCGYCPFSKKTVNNEELNKDKSALDKFVQFLKTAQSAITIFIVPYGEALIHDYYLETIAKLSNWNNIDKICIQTNNSFHLPKLLDYINKYNGNTDNIKLWCTYHPTWITNESFISKCNDLYKAGIEFSVGAVADCTKIESLALMRQNLPSDIYMWLNNMDGSTGKYTSYEINEFLNIDPFFELQLVKLKSDTAKCIGGKTSVFIDYLGNIFACNISNCRIGNIYEGFTHEVKCRSIYCHCFLAYSNRIDLPLLNLFQYERQLRILPKNHKAAYFFDIDGTILEKNGKMSHHTIEAIKALSRESYIFLNTALPVHNAYARCKKIWHYIHGGVFSNGSDIRIFEHNYKRIISMDPYILTLLDTRETQYFPNYYDEILHKILIKHCNKTLEKLLLSNQNRYNISRDNSGIIITDTHASKLKGALFICRFYNINHNNVTAFGNSENDIEILTYFGTDYSYIF